MVKLSTSFTTELVNRTLVVTTEGSYSIPDTIQPRNGVPPRVVSACPESGLLVVGYGDDIQMEYYLVYSYSETSEDSDVLTSLVQLVEKPNKPDMSISDLMFELLELRKIVEAKVVEGVTAGPLPVRITRISQKEW